MNKPHSLLATVLMECIRFRICALAVGCSPNPCTDGLFELQPTANAKLVDCKANESEVMSLAFREESFLVQDADRVQAQERGFE